MVDQLPLFSKPPAVSPEKPSAPSAPKPVRPGIELRSGSPLKAAIVAWCDHLEREGSSPYTVKSFGGDLKLFARHGVVGKTVGQITTRDLNNWLMSQRANGRSPKTYARRVTSLKAFFRWLHTNGVMAHDPAAAVVQQTVLSPLPQVLSAEEVLAAQAAAERLNSGPKPDIRPLVLFNLLLETGIKKSECLALVPNHIDLSDPANPALWVRYAEPRYRYKERKIALSPRWVALYQRYLAEYTPESTIFPYSPRRLEYLLEDITKAAALEKHISFEMCRWTCALRESQNGVDMDAIRQKLGLSKIQWREIGAKLMRLVTVTTGADVA